MLANCLYALREFILSSVVRSQKKQKRVDQTRHILQHADILID